MKNLLLMRHGKAVKQDEAISDFARILSPRGRDEVRRMGRSVASENIFRSHLLFSSMAVRAYESALLVAEEIGTENGKITVSENLYNNEEAAFIKELNSLSDYETAIVIGHNPMIERLASFFLPAWRYSIGTSSALLLSFDCSRWESAGADNCSFRWFKFVNDELNSFESAVYQIATERYQLSLSEILGGGALQERDQIRDSVASLIHSFKAQSDVVSISDFAVLSEAMDRMESTLSRKDLRKKEKAEAKSLRKRERIERKIDKLSRKKDKLESRLLDNLQEDDSDN